MLQKLLPREVTAWWISVTSSLWRVGFGGKGYSAAWWIGSKLGSCVTHYTGRRENSGKIVRCLADKKVSPGSPAVAVCVCCQCGMRHLLTWNDAISGLPVSQGSAEALVRWGGKTKRLSIAYFLHKISTQRYQNHVKSWSVSRDVESDYCWDWTTTVYWDSVEQVPSSTAAAVLLLPWKQLSKCASPEIWMLAVWAGCVWPSSTATTVTSIYVSKIQSFTVTSPHTSDSTTYDHSLCS